MQIYLIYCLIDKNGLKKNYNIDIKINKEIVDVDYISFKDLYNNIKSFSNYITKPHIFMTVISDLNQKEKIGTQVDISHTGFIINKNGNLYIRHASSKYKKVIDESFDKYIEKFLNNQKYKGFVIMEIKF